MRWFVIAILLLSPPAFAHAPSADGAGSMDRPLTGLAATHIGRWHGDHVAWRSTYFKGSRANWRLEFATPLPGEAEISLTPQTAWDGAARLELERNEAGAIVGVHHHGIATAADLLLRVPVDVPEPPLSRGSVHRLLLDGARVDRPKLPLEAHLGHVRHQKVSDVDIGRFKPAEGFAIFVDPDTAYSASGGLKASIRRDAELSEERLTGLSVGLTAFVVVLLMGGTQLSRRARREQLTA